MSGADFSGAGTDSAFRRELNEIMDKQAGRANMPFYMPVKEILAAAYRAFSAVPRIPDYDHEVATKQVWSSASEPVELGDLPSVDELHVQLERGDVVITMTPAEGEAVEIAMDPSDAETFFLAGLAAAAEGKRAFPLDKLAFPRVTD